MKPETEGSETKTPPTMTAETAPKLRSLRIVSMKGYEGVVAGPPGPTATVTVVPANLVWIGRNAQGDIAEILWDSDLAGFLPDDFETLRSKSPFQPFSVISRSGGPYAIVKSADELFVGQEAIVIKSGNGSIITIPISAIQAVEMPPGLEP